MLYEEHSRPLTVLHSDLESYALHQREVFVGTAGTVIERSNAGGFAFYAHQFYDGDGKQRERYLAGPVGSTEADAAAEELQARIEELKALVPSLRLLGREGFSLVNAKTYATLASLHNHGMFAAGALLIGSHAYGVLLNRLGIRARFPTSFKQRSDFPVDLAVPASDERLPYLDYLLAESQMAMLMAREGCCAVRVPLPERFAVHKLVISRIRTGRNAKAAKDLLQAVVLSAALAESHPGALETAVAALPKRARKHFASALAVVEKSLREHPRALDELSR
jgi:hypothetical protein